MKKVTTLHDVGGKPAAKPENAKHGGNAPLQPKKAESAHAYTKGGKKPKEEKAHKLETQPKNSVSKHAASTGHVGHEEEFHPEDFSRFGSRFTSDKHTKKGL